jgi:N-acetylmuramoyl-L-alanine amidase
MRQTLRREAATIRRILGVLFALLISLSLLARPSRPEGSAARRETAKNQFERAEKDLQSLEARPEKDRSLKEYVSVASAYRRVYLITPRAAEVPAALNQVGALYRTMGDLFQVKYYQMAVNTYEFLLREYPANRYREDAMLAIAQIEQNDLHDLVLARTSYQEFLSMHPHSSHAGEVRRILDELRGDGAAAGSTAKSSVSLSAEKDRTNPKPAVVEKSRAGTDASPEASGEVAAAAASGRPQVTRIRTWNADTYTRIVIDVGAQVKYQAARLSNPDRIYFDVENAKIDPELLHKPVDVESGGFLKSVRVGQNQLDVVRIVLEVDHAKDYSVSLLANPYRLVVDVYGHSAASEELARANSPAPAPAKDSPAAKAEKPAAELASKTLDKYSEKTPNRLTASSATVDITLNGKVSAESYSQMPQPLREATGRNLGSRSASVPALVDHPAQTDRIVEAAPLPALGSRNLLPPPPPVARTAPPKTKSARNSKSAHDQAEELGPPSLPEPTRDGQQSLSRALGLKIGRIVIDAGHGGHDTGTIGPTGLMEKDLCLDVALRVGKLIQQRLPSAEVIYTREDDTFIGLEQRTEIANDARADLFLSVHANSSPDHSARGIETYYLNFTASSDAMEVATRENALSENGVHDLQDILRKIARNEKIEESRDFAGTIQDSLARRVENINRGDKSRGVRKAPFVVLIGANMPSVLAEISFISNPSDEQWLKRPENRQRIAEGLYRGIETYLQNTNSLTVNQILPSSSNRSGIVARSGNPQ